MKHHNTARHLPTTPHYPRPAPPTIGAIDMIGYAPMLPMGNLSGDLGGGTGTGQLPSSESVNAVLNGEDNGWTKVVMSTALRAILIAPGLAMVGARGWKLAGGSLLSSTTITAFLFIFYRAHRS